MPSSFPSPRLAALALLGACASASPAPSPMEAGPGPAASLPSRPAEIAPADLRRRLEAFSHDSMQGREAGTPGHDRAVEYLARELGRMRLRPAGEDGTFFQSVPLIRNEVDRSIVLGIDGEPLRPGNDYAPYDARLRMKSLRDARVVYGGTVSGAASLRPQQVTDRFVVLRYDGGDLFPPIGPNAPLGNAVGVGITGIDSVYSEYASLVIRPTAEFDFQEGTPPLPVPVLLRSSAAARMFARPLAELRPGDEGKRLSGDIVYVKSETPSRNVVAVLPGTDPRLRGEYVALGAHSDHDGVRWGALNADSLRTLLLAEREAKAGREGPLTAAETARLEAEAARRSAGGAARMDSVFNGADDDGSGSVALLQLAEWFSRPENRPRRSLLFVWHTGEEKGMLGSRWYTDHPTVPRDSIVAQVNIDMIGRGGADDLPGGGPDYLQILGAKRLSREYGELVEAVNRGLEQPFRFDYQFDAAGHPEQYYCRSDHWNYARFGIPVVFFSTGDHVDYHQLTDEARYIDYDHYARVVSFVGGLVRTVGDLDRRPRLDGPRPDPNAECVQ